MEWLEDRRLLSIIYSANEDFETGDFSRFPWTHFGNANWTITSADQHGGTYSARSGVILDSQLSSLRVTLDTDAGDISFWRKGTFARTT